ncbi:MAG: NnrS family protein [Magnetococcales bacterium]|nr:NnrS family protein [Magnetococcales bacterium]
MMRYRLTGRFFHSAPPPPAMVFNREPLMQRFWGSGLLFMVAGFGLGLWLWLEQQGWLSGWAGVWPYHDLRAVHASWQIVYFTGAFLLGFALQAGPHLLGSPPPPLPQALKLLGLFQAGWLLSWLPFTLAWDLSRLVTTVALLWAVWLLAGMVRSGLPAHRAGIGLPLIGGIAALAVAVWLPLQQPQWGLWALWLGPVTVILAAAQQLIANVLGGQRLIDQNGRWFALLLAGCWATTTRAAVWNDEGSWRLAGAIWTVTLIGYWIRTGLWQALRRGGVQSLTMALGCGLAVPLVAALWLLLDGNAEQDRVLHLLALGAVVPLIVAVTARVATFFSGGYVLPEPWLIVVLGAWIGVILLRVLPPWPSMAIHLDQWLPLPVALIALLLGVWVNGLARRLWIIQTRARAMRANASND